jgi:type I site-specific restriction-modification system R (restriction) subunit
MFKLDIKLKRNRMNLIFDNDFSENTLVEQTAIALFRDLGWGYANCFHEFEQPGGSPLGRQTKSVVILESRLRPVLKKLNSGLPGEALSQAIEEISRDRSPDECCSGQPRGLYPTKGRG